MTKYKTLKTGSDPRTLPDYAALRDELSKLTHPARPDVNWRYAEKLCLSLFEQNGVELQTATEQQHDWIRQHRKYCFSYSKPIKSPGKLDVTEIARAAKAAQERMGLSHPDGAAFRLKDEKITD